MTNEIIPIIIGLSIGTIITAIIIGIAKFIRFLISLSYLQKEVIKMKIELIKLIELEIENRIIELKEQNDDK